MILDLLVGTGIAVDISRAQGSRVGDTLETDWADVGSSWQRQAFRMGLWSSGRQSNVLVRTVFKEMRQYSIPSDYILP